VVRSRALQACGKERCYRLAGPRTLQSPRRKEQWVGVRVQYRRRARLTRCGNVLIFGSAVASRSRQLPPARLGFIRSPAWGDLSRPFIVDKIQWGNYSHECTVLRQKFEMKLKTTPKKAKSDPLRIAANHQRRYQPKLKFCSSIEIIKTLYSAFSES
jgi:hypothetical protein